MLGAGLIVSQASIANASRILPTIAAASIERRRHGIFSVSVI
jgi:hypothetical protein